jgi:hypothetical protein
VTRPWGSSAGATGISASRSWRTGHLYVFQRTPSSVDVRANAPTDLEWFTSAAGWQQDRMVNFVAYRGLDPVDLIQDGWVC